MTPATKQMSSAFGCSKRFWACARGGDDHSLLTIIPRGTRKIKKISLTIPIVSDIILTVDGLRLEDGVNIRDLIKDLEDRWNPAYPILFEVIGEDE